MNQPSTLDWPAWARKWGPVVAIAVGALAVGTWFHALTVLGPIADRVAPIETAIIELKDESKENRLAVQQNSAALNELAAELRGLRRVDVPMVAEQLQDAEGTAAATKLQVRITADRQYELLRKMAYRQDSLINTLRRPMRRP